MRILVAEDDRSILQAVTKRLKEEMYAVDACENGSDAYDYLVTTEYDAAVLDIMMPKMNGLEVVRRIREKGVTSPILFLTARDAVSDRVEGFDAGGDDYLVKPFAFDELLARLRALTRRTSNKTQLSDVYSVDNLIVDTRSHTVTRNGRAVSLTSREYSMLEYMIRNKGAVLTREQIESRVWSYEYEGASNMVDVYIRYLRKKIDTDGEKKLIHTVKYTGYVLRADT